MKRVKLLTERTLREKKYLLRGKYSKTSQLIVPPTLLSETISFEGESGGGGGGGEGGDSTPLVHYPFCPGWRPG